MKRTRLAALMLCLVMLFEIAGSEGLLPSFDKLLGTEMPAMSSVIGRAPEKEEILVDGSIRQVYSNVTGDEYNAFSVYLENNNCTLESSVIEARVFSAVISKDYKTFSFRYDITAGTVEFIYPNGTYPESVSMVTSLTQKEVSVGDVITFGHYPQTSAGNDNTPIEWIVLEVDGNKALLLSRYGLDAKPFNERSEAMIWETCTLRAWLNESFMNAAFKPEERVAIQLTELGNSISDGFNGIDYFSGGHWFMRNEKATQDRLFLLSCAEAAYYLGVNNTTYDIEKNNRLARVAPTAYAIFNGASTSIDYLTLDDMASWWWWLRSPGKGELYAAYIGIDGSIRSQDVTNSHGCVRPAMWVDLESGIF